MMGRPRRKLTGDEFQYLQLIRMNCGFQILTAKKMMEKLSELGGGYWKNYSFLNNLVEQEILVRVGKGQYKFGPSFTFEQLSKAVKKFQNNRAKQRISSRKKKIVKEAIEEASVTIVSSTSIEEAIDLLKNNGYKVMIRHFDVDSALSNPGKSVESFITWTEC